MAGTNGATATAAASAAVPREDARAILEALEKIERRLDRVEAIAQRAATEAAGAVAMVTDGVDHAIARMRDEGVDVDVRLKNVLRAAERLTSDEAIATLNATFTHIEAIRTVLDSGVFDPGAVAIVAQAGKALAEAAAEPPSAVGPFGLVRAIGEADVRNATGFLVRFARRLGRALSTTDGKQLAADNERSAR